MFKDKKVLINKMSDDLFDSIMKSFLAQVGSALKISKIISEHSSEEEVSEDAVICGLVYRLMTPMKSEEMTESLDNASDIYDKILNGDEESGESDEEEIIIEERNISRKIKVNLCNCDSCMRARICIINYNNHEPKDNLEVMFKNAIDTACKKGKI